MAGLSFDDKHDADAILRDPFEETAEEDNNEEEETTELELGGDSRRAFESLEGEDDYSE